MGAFEYMKSIHGLLSIVLSLVGLVALLAVAVVWHNGEIAFLLYIERYRLVSVVLVALLLFWGCSFGLLLAQLFFTDILEQLGKTKLLLIHALSAAAAIGCGALQAFYVRSETDNEFYYVTRLYISIVCMFVMALSYIAQLILVVLQ